MDQGTLQLAISREASTDGVTVQWTGPTRAGGHGQAALTRITVRCSSDRVQVSVGVRPLPALQRQSTPPTDESVRLLALLISDALMKSPPPVAFPAARATRPTRAAGMRAARGQPPQRAQTKADDVESKDPPVPVLAAPRRPAVAAWRLGAGATVTLGSGVTSIRGGLLALLQRSWCLSGSNLHGALIGVGEFGGSRQRVDLGHIGQLSVSSRLYAALHWPLFWGGLQLGFGGGVGLHRFQPRPGEGQVAAADSLRLPWLQLGPLVGLHLRLEGKTLAFVTLEPAFVPLKARASVNGAPVVGSDSFALSMAFGIATNFL
ncbi:MAG: hypothetical protein ACPGUV_02480 [Polyangiales bacterium]